MSTYRTISPIIFDIIDGNNTTDENIKIEDENAIDVEWKEVEP